VDEAEAARLCGVSKPTFRDWVGAGLVTRVALPKGMRRNLYRLAELKEFADKLAGERS
jgi:predicted site-specific integrase-resolvase